MLCTNVGVSPADDARSESAGADLAHAADFRVRVSAALMIGKTHPEGGRVMLEHALGDTHPAVRTAAAAALGALGDPAAIAALERTMRGESSGSVRSQIQSTIAALRGGSGGGGGGTKAANGANARYVVQIGAMKNATNVRGADLSNVLRAAVRSQAASLPGAVVVDAGDGSQDHAGARMPVLLLDGQLTRLSQNASSGSMRIEAQVEFSVRRIPQQTLQGTLTGRATSIEPVRGMSAGRVVELQNQAVGGAVESAMRGADRGLTLAAK